MDPTNDLNSWIPPPTIAIDRREPFAPLPAGTPFGGDIPGNLKPISGHPGLLRGLGHALSSGASNLLPPSLAAAYGIAQNIGGVLPQWAAAPPNVNAPGLSFTPDISPGGGNSPVAQSLQQGYGINHNFGLPSNVQQIDANQRATNPGWGILGYGNRGKVPMPIIHPFFHVHSQHYGPQPGAMQPQAQNLASQYTQAYAAAKQANLDRYNQLLAGYTGLQQRAMHDFNASSNQAASDINQQYDNMAAQEQQRLVSEGLANSSIIAAGAANRGRSVALNSLNDQRAQQRAALDQRLTGNVLHQIESRSDPYPNQQEFLKAMMALGRYGGAPVAATVHPGMLGGDPYGGGFGQLPRSMRPDLLHEGQHGRNPPGNPNYGGFGQAGLQAARQRGMGETTIGQNMGPWL